MTGSIQPWYQLLYNDFWGTPLVDSGSHGSYRPLCVLSYKLNHIVGGLKPFGYHLINVLLHCLSTGLVVKLARHILPNGISIVISGLLFATHPIHTEAVAGIVGRADLIACNFYILTILSYIKHVQWRKKCYLRHWMALCGAILSASAAVLCKETAVTALVICIIYDILKGFNTFLKDKVSFKFPSFYILCCRHLDTTARWFFLTKSNWAGWIWCCISSTKYIMYIAFEQLLKDFHIQLLFSALCWVKNNLGRMMGTSYLNGE